MSSPETRSPNPENRRHRTRAIAVSFATLLALITLSTAGCTYNSSNSEPETLRQKQEETTRDPMNYKPDNENVKPYDISGGGFNNLDSNALKKDMDHVLDP